MRGGIHYIDLHYKGIKIMRGWRNLLYHCFLIIYVAVACVCMAVVCYRMNWNPFCFSAWQYANWKKVVIVLVMCMFTSFLVTGTVAVVFYPVWDYIANLQRLCRLIYSYPLYITNDIMSPNMFKEERSQVKKEIAYFASLYYRQKKGITEVTVKLDGSKFHKSGDFGKLLNVLEDVYGLNVVDIIQRQGFLTYSMLSDALKLRIGVNDVIPQKYSIPLMCGVSWNIAKIPHALVVGGTGGGKSFFLNILIRAFVLMGAQICICDPKNSALADYSMVMSDVAVDSKQIIKNVYKCVETMESRYITIKEHKNYISGQDFTHYGIVPLVLIIDEYVAFADTLQKKEKDEFKSYLKQIILKGREAGVFAILATQRPDAEYISGNIRDQLGMRVTLGKMSDDGYRMAFGTYEQKLKNKGIQGRGYIYMDGYTFIQEFYAPLVPKGYKFIDETGKLLGVEPHALTPESGKARADSNAQEGGEAAYIVKEIIYEQE